MPSVLVRRRRLAIPVGGATLPTGPIRVLRYVEINAFEGRAAVAARGYLETSPSVLP
jgi:hypothetical protein